jgi:heptosyltransferase-2/heptosyltransferase-3
MKPITNFRPDKILVCQLRQIGDVVLTTPLIRLLKEHYPHAGIDVFTEKKCAPVLYNNPDISNIWELDKHKHTGIFHNLALYRHIGRQGYDLVVDCQQLPRCRFATLFSKAKVRLTYPPPWYNKLLYTHWATPIEGYAAKYKASFLAPLGITWNGEPPRIYLTESETIWANKFFKKHNLPQPGGPVLTIDPTHRRSTRRWPAEHYARLLGLLAHKVTNLTAILLYGPGEKREVTEIARMSGVLDRCIIPEKMLTLREMAAIIAKADLHVGNCSGPRHIAVAVDTPSLAILGSTSQAWTFPGPDHTDIALKIPCQPCNKDICPLGTNECLHKLSPEKVLTAILCLQQMTHNQDQELNRQKKSAVSQDCAESPKTK